MSSLSIKKVSIEEQHEEFINEIKSLKTEIEGLKQLSEDLITENMTLITKNETLLTENEMLKNIISKLCFQSAGLTSSFLKLNCMSLDWEYIQK